jgi:hypothetical protein
MLRSHLFGKNSLLKTLAMKIFEGFEPQASLITPGASAAIATGEAGA